MNKQNLKTQLEVLGPEVVAEVVNQLVAADKVATGSLINSVRFEVLEAADAVMLNIISNDYLKYIDEGRRPGSRMPPVKSIKPWVEAKGIVFRNRKTGMIYTSEQAAFVIAKSIAKKGIQPLNIKQKVVDNVINRREELIALGLSIDIKEYIDKEIFQN